MPDLPALARLRVEYLPDELTLERERMEGPHAVRLGSHRLRPRSLRRASSSATDETGSGERNKFRAVKR